MSYFDDLLKKRSLTDWHTALWKLKITGEEYEELRQLLCQQASLCNYNYTNPFMVVKRECALFYAEYWRREYAEGAHSKQMVYDALKITNKRVNLSEELYEAAKRGAKMLHLELYKEGGHSRYLESMLYQGGLPMKLLTNGNQASVWGRFARGLVNRRFSLDELQLGTVASANQSLNEYCKQLIIGIETESYRKMPFYCKDENDAWYIYMIDLSKQERQYQREIMPFTLDFDFKIDDIEHIIEIKYHIKGNQRLPQNFFEREGLGNPNFISVQVMANGKTVDTFDYLQKYCHLNVESKHLYHAGDRISLHIDGCEQDYLASDLDMDIPRLLYYNERKERYQLGNKIGLVTSLLLLPDNWEIRTDLTNTGIEIKTYTWEHQSLRGISIPANFSEEIQVEGEDEIITFGSNIQLYWTELVSQPLYQPNIDEQIYDVHSCKFRLCKGDGNLVRFQPANSMEYRNKWQHEWNDTPSFGEIFARAKDNAGNYVTPTKLINAGDGLQITPLEADDTKCLLKVTWKHGRVSTSEGIRRTEETWEIKKENCKGHRIHFTFTPDNNPRNQFTLSLKPPFKEFSIYDNYDNAIIGNCMIPYVDIDQYQYHLVGQDISYSINGKPRELKWIDNALYITQNGTRPRKIPYEGSLLQFFDSREMLYAMLERTSQNLIKAVIEVEFYVEPYPIKLIIKEYPFGIFQNEGGTIYTTPLGNNFKGYLKLLRLDDPTCTPIRIYYDRDNDVNKLPEDIRPWGKTLVIGQTKGRIRPTLVDLTQDTDAEYRVANRKESMEQITAELQNAKLGDKTWERIIRWFELAQKENIPASSLLDFVCIAQNPEAILCFAFQLYAYKSESERDTLIEELGRWSNELAFEWYWLLRKLDNILHIIDTQDIHYNILYNIYIQWAVQQGDKLQEYLQAMNQEDTYLSYFSECIIKGLLPSFKAWMKKLCTASLLDNYLNKTNNLTTEIVHHIVEDMHHTIQINYDEENHIDFNQDDIDERTKIFFNQFKVNGKSNNELWLYERVQAVCKHFCGKLDLFTLSEQIRRSIIFCHKSCNKQFLIELNNLIKYNKNEIR